MTDDDLLQLLHDTADAVAAAIGRVTDWGLTGTRDGQYKADLLADEAALDVLRRAGVGVLSEESGLEHPERGIVIMVDPLDGSTNASRGVPWFATALCAVDGDGPVASVVAHQAGGPRYWAARGRGAWTGSRRLVPSGCRDVGDAILGLNGLPPEHFGWAQFRVMGAAALDLCLVADGVTDGYVDCATGSHGVWDYCASLLICREAGVPCEDAFGRDLVVRDHTARRTPVAAATPELMATLMAARGRF